MPSKHRDGRKQRKPADPMSAMVSPVEAARLLGVSRRMVDRLTSDCRVSAGADGIGPVYQLSARCTRLPRVAVLAWLERRRRPGDAPADAPIF